MAEATSPGDPRRPSACIAVDAFVACALPVIPTVSGSPRVLGERSSPEDRGRLRRSQRPRARALITPALAAAMASRIGNPSRAAAEETGVGKIDMEVRDLVEAAFQRARLLLLQNRDCSSGRPPPSREGRPPDGTAPPRCSGRSWARRRGPPGWPVTERGSSWWVMLGLRVHIGALAEEGTPRSTTRCRRAALHLALDWRVAGRARCAVSITGRSGSGKVERSSTWRLVDAPTAGRVRLLGRGMGPAW